ncbi:hypothetical protein [Mariniplasma anaerobium]|uniref:Uncharacterized protein n=1 Tax=Mariniplasma anaerobium TaxID=2735436 RepID=A0A7U9TIE0_9MOLU|nr:hypothetical protein [Mariniplasma anaerobium]BCR35774.1 hypothetical protein MPAN_006670 [Mariniplasma anaerobium]
MKYKIILKKEEEIIFDGKPIDLPIKKDVLKQKSFEMFGDEEPCIIHQVYIIEFFCDALVSRFKDNLDQEIKLSDSIEEIKFIDIKNIDQTTLIIRRK